MEYQVFKEHLLQLAAGTGKTQAELARALNMSAPTLNRYLLGQRKPDLPYVVKIARYFDVSIDWLLGVSGEKFEVMPPEMQEVMELYAVATKDDRRVVQAVLSKYRTKPAKEANEP